MMTSIFWMGTTILLTIVVVLLLRTVRLLYAQRQRFAVDPFGEIFVHPDLRRTTVYKEGLLRVRFLGDSRAQQWFPPDLDGRVDVSNRGIGGQTSAQVLGRLDRDALNQGIDVLVLQVGVNDLKSITVLRQHGEEIESHCYQNISEIVRRCVDARTRVIVTTIFPVGRRPVWRRIMCGKEMREAVKRMNQHLRRLESADVALLDAHSILVAKDGYLCNAYERGFVHINRPGYEALNMYLLPLLESKTSPPA